MYRKYRLQIHIAITLLIMAFIFYQSSLPAVLSSEMSGHLERIVAAILGKPSESVTFAVRKAAHVTEFAALGSSLFYTVRDLLDRYYGGSKALLPKNCPASQNSPISQDRPASQDFKQSKLYRIVLPWAIGTIYAISDEVHQLFVEGRSCELRDMLIDSAGVIAGVLLMSWLDKRRRRRLSA